jgi:hypothetical protein
MTRPPSAAGERDDPTRLAGFHDRFGERTVVVDADTGDVIEHLQVVPVLAAQERAIRERVERLANFRHVRFPRLRGVESSSTGSDRRVVVLADHVPGHRLSGLLAFVDRHPTLSVDVNAALQVVREVLPALAVLHDSRGVTHGTVGLERMVLTAQGRVVLVDYALGLAVERLQYPRSRLWKDFRLAMPPTAGVPRLDQRADVAQVALVLLALLLGRPVAFGEFPEGLRPLLQATVERLPDGTVRPLSAPLKAWLERALPLESRKPFTTALDAQMAFEDLIKKARGYSPSAASLKAFLQRYEVCLAKETTPPEARPREVPARGSAGRTKTSTSLSTPVQREAARPAAGGSHTTRQSTPRPLSPEEEAADEVRSLEAELARLARTGDGQSSGGEISRPSESATGRAVQAAGTPGAVKARTAPADSTTDSPAAPGPERRAVPAAAGEVSPDRSKVTTPADAGTPVAPAAAAGPQEDRTLESGAEAPAGQSVVETAVRHPLTRHRASTQAARTRAVAETTAPAEASVARSHRLPPRPEPAEAVSTLRAADERARADSSSAECVPQAAEPQEKPAPASPAPTHAEGPAVEAAGEVAAGAAARETAPLGEPETEVLVLGQPLPAIEIVSMPDGTETRLVVSSDGTPDLAAITEVPSSGRAAPDEEDEVAYLERMLRELAASEAAQATPGAEAAAPTLARESDQALAVSEAGSASGPATLPSPADQQPVQFQEVASETGGRAPAGQASNVAAGGTGAPVVPLPDALLVVTPPPVPDRTEVEEAGAWRLEPPPLDDTTDVLPPPGAPEEAEEESRFVDEWSLWLDFEKEPEPLALVQATEPFHRRLRRKHGRPGLGRADVTRLQMLTAIHGREDGTSRPAARSRTSKGTPREPRPVRRSAGGRTMPRALPAEATPVQAAIAVRPPSGIAEIVAQAASATRAAIRAPLVLVPEPDAKRRRVAAPPALPERCDREAAPLARRPARGLAAALAERAVEGAAVVRLVPGLPVEILGRERRGVAAVSELSAIEAGDAGSLPGVAEIEAPLTAEPALDAVNAAAAASTVAPATHIGSTEDSGELQAEPLPLPRLEDLVPAESASETASDPDSTVLRVVPSAEEELRRLLAALSADVGAAEASRVPSTTAPEGEEASLAAWALDAAEPLDLAGLADVEGATGWLSDALLGADAAEEARAADSAGSVAPSSSTEGAAREGPGERVELALSAGTLDPAPATGQTLVGSVPGAQPPLELGLAEMAAADAMVPPPAGAPGESASETGEIGLAPAEPQDAAAEPDRGPEAVRADPVLEQAAPAETGVFGLAAAALSVESAPAVVAPDAAAETRPAAGVDGADTFEEEPATPVLRLESTAGTSSDAVAADAAPTASHDGSGAATPAADRAAGVHAAPPLAGSGAERPAAAATSPSRDLRLVPSPDVAAPAGPVGDAARAHLQSRTGTAGTTLPVAEAGGEGAAQGSREWRSEPARGDAVAVGAEGASEAGNRGTGPAGSRRHDAPLRSAGAKPGGKRRGKRRRPVPPRPAHSAPVAVPARPLGELPGSPASVQPLRIVAAAPTGTAPATEPPGSAAAASGRPAPVSPTYLPPAAGAAGLSAKARPPVAEPPLDQREQSSQDLALVYAPWRLNLPPPAVASREADGDGASAADPWNLAPETARIRLAPPEVPLAGSTEQQPVGVAPIAAVPAAVPTVVPEPASAPALAARGPDLPEAPFDPARPVAPEPVLFASWQERAPAPPAVRRWRVDWKRTAAAALVVVLLEGVAFATAYWFVRPPENGTLLVQASEEGVEVWIDGRQRGRTPLSVELEPGRHTLEMRGYGAAKTMPVEISPGVQTTQFVRWRRAVRTGTLKVTTTPDGARILLDGRYRGVSPLVIENVPAGTHTIVAEHASGTVRSSVDVAADATTEADVGIFSGWLAVFAPIEVRIFLGGRFLGTSLDGKLLVPPGHHEIEVVNTRLGYRETREVDIEPGRTTAVSIEAPNGTIAIEAPDGTEVSIDGKTVGVMPLDPVAAPIGMREVILRHPQLGQRRIAVSVGLNAPARVSLLAPQ